MHMFSEFNFIIIYVDQKNDEKLRSSSRLLNIVFPNFSID